MPAEQTFTDHKIIYLKKSAPGVLSWRKEARKLVFTNGCFDILHWGHVRYLQTPAGFGDILLLGLNSVSSVRNLKGPRRPIMTQADRAICLVQLKQSTTFLFLTKKHPPD
ncbi:MAG: hypothetical protein CM1200mP28_11100 [Deltaproteobacteria bacterium]|nr:MAG: hypothetical protein CM1200mP28_11100 [Deltaproteobacteria bacterium]